METRSKLFRDIFFRPAIYFLFLAAVPVFARPAPVADAELPLTRAVLFKNGMGFFEYEGTVRDQETVRIPITSSQLDDVLKSLIVLDLDGGVTGAVSYGSAAPLERQFEELETGDLRGKDLAAVLRQLIGTPVSADAPGGRVEGRLLNAEVRAVSGNGGEAVEVIELALYTGEGELLTLTLQSLKGLTFTSESTRKDLSRYLEVVADARNSNIRHLEITTQGTGERRIRLSHTAETPVWKATYRLILEDGGSAFLQGWAIVDNTTSSDWNSIDLSLVSSSPVSFIQRLSEPVYGHRPEVPVSIGPQVAPELHQGGIETFESRAKAQREMDAPREQMLGMGERSVASSGYAPAVPLAEAIQASTLVAAAAGTVGDQFEYRIKRPVTLRKNQSALIPILQAELEAEKVSVYTAGRPENNPRRAVWIENNTGLTLDGGPFSINDSGLFAGEGLFDTLYPEEKRLLSYALDRAVTIEENIEGSRRSFQGLTRERGVLVISHKLLESKVYRIRNNADSGREVVIEHPLRNGWDLVSPASPEEKSSDWFRFRTRVDSKKTASLEVREERTVSQRIALDSITENELRVWISGAEMDSNTREKLAPLVAQVREISESRGRINSLNAEKERIYASQERLRQNLSSLGSSAAEAGLRQRYVTQMEEQENRLLDLERDLEKEEAGLGRLQQELADMIASIEF